MEENKLKSDENSITISPMEDSDDFYIPVRTPNPHPFIKKD